MDADRHCCITLPHTQMHIVIIPVIIPVPGVHCEGHPQEDILTLTLLAQASEVAGCALSVLCLRDPLYSTP